MRKPPLPRPQLHVITPAAAVRAPLELVTGALRGGADVIQFRDKGADRAESVRVAQALREATRAAGGLLVINDHLEVALAVGADGLHVGPEDLPIAEARRRWSPPAILGASARDPERAALLVRGGADYLGVGPVFATRTKTDAPAPIGPTGLSLVAGAVPVPVIGIGGIDASNAAEVLEAGAAGVAVISCVAEAPDVEEAVRALRHILDAHGKA